MSAQTDSISRYCVVHGHVPDAGGKFCLNCGALDMKSAVEHADANEPSPIRPLMEADASYQISAAESAQLASEISPGPIKAITKPTNPKDAIGAGKLPMHLVPSAVARYAALGFTEGALKYGKYNWRIAGVRISIYLDAMHRHLAKLQDGEWCDGDMLGPDTEGKPQGTQVPHLSSIICCAGIILDAWECDKLTDDRPPVNPHVSADMDSRIDHIAYLKKIFETYNPHQHVITDAPEQG